MGADSLTALRAVPAEKLREAQTFRTGVNVDGYVLPESVRSLFAEKKHNLAPVLVGSNANEWTTLSNRAQFPKTVAEYRKYLDTAFGPAAQDAGQVYPVKTDADIADAMLAIGRDRTFTLEMRTWARMVTAAGQQAYLYQFAHVPPSPNAKEWGAYHASEIPYVFGTLRNRPWPFTNVDFTLSDRMASYWVNFAKTGDPNGSGLPKWTPYDASSEPYLELGDAIASKQHLLKAQLDFLEQAQQRRAATQN
jgi:para-nitrobenzyl esterase